MPGRPADGLVGGSPVDGRPTAVMSLRLHGWPAPRARTIARRTGCSRWRPPAAAGRPASPRAAAARRHRRARASSGLDCMAFAPSRAAERPRAPRSGSSPAAASRATPPLLGCCDVVIATGVVVDRHGRPGDDRGRRPRRVRPRGRRPVRGAGANGVIDVAVADEAEAVAAAKRTSPTSGRDRGRRTCARPVRAAHPRPGGPARVYDVRPVLGPGRTGSVLELRRGFGRRDDHRAGADRGRPVGVIANDPTHLGGAIDADGADKAARFIQLCDAFDLPLAVPLSTRRGSWSVPSSSARPMVRRCRGCS